MDDIAVIGLGLRFPGDASSPQSLWKILEHGESQWSEIPKDRLNINGYHHPGGERQGSCVPTTNPSCQFFSIAAADAKAIDPQQRLLLEVCYEALENAGCTTEDIDGTDTSVYVGSFVKDYEQICLRDPDWQPQYAATGNGIAIMANRISYYFNLHGPSMTIDTGCSGSLVSVHLAAQSLRSGESSLAIAAGAGLILTPNTIMPMTALSFLSPDGKCFTFDARANGYGRGEGVGVVILKRLSDAIRDNDTIRAVIRGTHVNQDGRTPGITLPSKEAQVANIRSVYSAAGLSFSDTAYVECHGTGTQAGDWRELKAISETLGASRTTDNPIFVGSVKPNIGHLEGAAGVAGLIKAVLMLERERIPPHVNFETPNPDIDFREWKVKVSRAATAWPSNLKKRVSVNCFGFGGTNAHVILDGAAEYLQTKQLVAHHASASPRANNGLPLRNGSLQNASSHSKHQGLGQENWQIFCYSSHERSDNLADDFLTNYAYTLGCRRSRLEWRSFFLQASPRLCFLFCGQGAQWARMGLDLRPFPVFWNSINSAACTRISQPATTVIQIAIVDLLQSLGIEPDFVVGHSSGEIAAAYASGALSREEAWEVAYYRGLASSTLQSRRPGFRGGMIAVFMSLDQATSYIHTFSDPLEIACVNSPSSITLSGRRETIEHASRDLAAKNIRQHVLPVDMAYHSTHMKNVEDHYVHNINCISPRPSRKAGSSLDAGYWGRNMVSTVQFSSAIESLMALPEDQQPSTFIEMGPSAVLRTLVLNTLGIRVKPEQILSALDKRRPGVASILNVAGGLWSAGHEVNIKSAISRRFGQGRPRCLTNLPSYPWNHTKSYWHESHLSLANRFREYGRLDLIGAPTADSVSFEPRWRGFLRISENPWIQDHQLQKTVIYPAAGMISMVLEGARQLKRGFEHLIGYEIRDMCFEKAIVVPDTAHGVEMALNMRAETDAGNQRLPNGHFTFSIYTKALEKEWERHATGNLHFCCQSQDREALLAAFHNQHGQVSEACTASVNPRQMYEHLDSAGISYGPTFRNILEVKKGSDRCISRIRVPDTRSKMPANFEHPHLLHPATLDSMFQTLFALDPVPKIPCSVQSIFVSDKLDMNTSQEFVGHAVAKQQQRNEAVAQISMCCTDRPLDQIIIKGLRFSGNLFATSRQSSFLPNYRNLATEIVWREHCDTAQFKSLRHAISLLCHKNPRLSILQIGGELSLAQCALLAASENADQPIRLGRYSFIDQKQSSLDFNDVNTAPYSRYLEQIPDMALVQSKYDLILFNGCAEDELNEAERFLKPDGIMLQSIAVGSGIETPSGNNTTSKFDLGWSRCDLQTEWRRRTGTPCALEMDESSGPILRRISTRGQGLHLPQSVVLLFPSTITEEASIFEAQFGEYAAVNFPATTLSAQQLSDAARRGSFQAEALYISLVDVFSEKATEGCIFNWSEADFNAFHLLQRTVKTIVWITRGAGMIPTAPRASPIIGLLRTLMSEDLQKKFATFNLSQESSLSAPKTLDMLVTVCRSMTDPTLSAGACEVDFAESGGALFIPRLETLSTLNNFIEKGDRLNSIVEGSFRTTESEAGRQIVLESSLHQQDSPPELDSPFCFREVDMGELGPQDIAISFESAILVDGNPGATGQEARKWQSYDVAGYVSATGKDIEDYTIGDKVMALVPGGNGLRTTVRVDAALVMPHKPGFVPSHFLSAYYALFDIGKIRKGKSILIHAGASGFGLAASELALMSGAVVLATVRGPQPDRQRDILQKRGIRHDHILDGNHDSYPSLVRLLTRGRGVDLVYNPTHMDTQLSVACVRQCGTVVHFINSSEDSSPVNAPGMPVTMVGFDLATLLLADLDHATEMIGALNDFAASTSLEWMSDFTLQQQFDISQLPDALEAVDESPHIGSNIAFLSRSGASSSTSTEFLQWLSEQGVTAKAFSIDICDQAALEHLLKATVSATMPPIAGVFHCAAVIKDAVFDNMTYENWNAGFKPKALGADNLVKAVDAVADDPFYVFLASSAGVIGTRGQANYSAGNAFLDALAGNLRIRGKRATSLDLGPILGAGMLAEDEALLDILRASGFYGIRHADFLTVIKHAITGETFQGVPLPSQIVLGVGTGGLMLQNQPADPYWSRTAMYSYLNIVDVPEPNLDAPAATPSLGIKAELMSCGDAEAAASIVCGGLSSMLAKSMNMAAEEIDPSRTPSAYGVDSLVAVGVRNWVSGNCGVDVSVFEIMSDLTVLELSRLVVQTGKFGLRAQKP
ncbi:Beta-ketoacyl synthase [Cordyceps fumosorosea ARSEF 2679]|uniref:Beta-ketoacyl synthase n=1 Tax=Cordyceps fumosorosea (strain ARSEF 2679) TaxID=1081104 RepID=A0A162LL06_CORFA|nr:Beta-ketoacyl synthase [Cordyceps fumosorosea ARSEF 2679]OAA72144.1 Beta-ketoacyl synthase [Cordyceps fumosorosea ARSEF 2679]